MTAVDWFLVALGVLFLSASVGLIVGAAMRETDRPQPERGKQPAEERRAG